MNTVLFEPSGQRASRR